MSEQCGDHLMEAGWEEGFDCSLPPNHDGQHRDMTDWNEINEGKDTSGKSYRWAYEWEYIEGYLLSGDGNADVFIHCPMCHDIHLVETLAEAEAWVRSHYHLE